MIQMILGKKIGMTQVFREDGAAVGVTAIQAGPCTVTQIKTGETDGYSAVQLAFGERKRLNKPMGGHLKGVQGKPRFLREARVTDAGELKVGDKVDVGIFKPGDIVDVIGTSIGKGFAGGVKRYHFRGGPKTHGQSDRLRAPGSIGSTTTPGHVLKGLRMAGHLGDHRATVQNLEVVEANPEKNLLLIKGAVPGANNGLLIIRKAIKSPA